MKRESDIIQLFKVNNLVPMIVMVVTLAGFFFNLSSRIDLLNQKVDLVLANQELTIKQLQAKDAELYVQYAKMQGQWGDLTQRVTRLER